MSIVDEPVVNKTAVKPFRYMCYDNNLVTSQGVFLGDNPLKFSLPTLLLEMSLIFLTTRAVHYFLRRLGQPRMVSHIITGMILGPSVVGRGDAFVAYVFPPRGTYILDILSLVSLILFIFAVGVKTDLGLLKKPGRRAVTIGIVGSLTPLVLTAALYFACKRSIPASLKRRGLFLTLSERLSLSSFAVIADALEELGLLNSGLGRIVMSATLIADISSWVANVAISTVSLVTVAKSPAMAAASVAAFVAFVLFIVFAARPMMLWVVKRTPAGELVSEGCYLGMMLGALAAATVTELIGYHPTFGPFLLGLALPGGMPLGVTLSERLDSFLSGLFLPLYLVLAGYRTNFSSLRSWAQWGYIELVVVVCYIGKLVGTIAAARYFKMSMRDSVTMGLMLNIKGIIEISFFNSWGDNDVATSEHFSILMISLLFNTAITTPLVKLLYNPELRFVASKRRTVLHSKPLSPLRVLAVVHTDDHVPPLLDLLEATHPTPRSPLILHLLHLTVLSGRAAAVLRPHKNPRKPSAAPTPSDRIVNAFRYFEHQHPAGAVLLHPYLAISPPATMHNDVCSLALDKKSRLIVLPFHKHSDGARETARPALQSLNRSVLDLAPCSVAVLVDRGGAVTCAHTNHLMQRVVVYVLGGSADDKEAVAVAMRMAAGGIGVTVVRFRVEAGHHDQDQDQEEELDEEMMAAVNYVEKGVRDGEGTVGVIREMSEKFDMVVVGRRKGVESRLTRGVAGEWSECPELGVLGDMLAAAEFGGKVAVLVVQMQQRVEEGGGGGGDRNLESGRRSINWRFGPL